MPADSHLTQVPSSLLFSVSIMVRFLLLAALGATVYFWLHPPTLLRTEWWRRKALPAIVTALTVLYVISPLDLIPGVSPIGWIDDLLVVIAAYLWLRRRLPSASPDATTGQRRQQPRAEASPTPWDPYAVLGVGRGASAAEITRAYREQMKRYHPDRVADLGDELRQVAHEKTLEIQRAYRELS